MEKLVFSCQKFLYFSPIKASFRVLLRIKLKLVENYLEEYTFYIIQYSSYVQA